MEKFIFAIFAVVFSAQSLAETVFILGVKPTTIATEQESNAGTGAIVGGIAGGLIDDSWSGAAVGAIGGAIIGDVSSSTKEVRGVKLKLRLKDESELVVIQPGNVKDFELGSAEMRRTHVDGKVQIRVRSNAW